MRQVLCPTLLGRAEETRRLGAALAAAQAGHGGTLFLVGEAGIGKSRLVRHTVGEAGARGMRTLTGRAVARGVSAPFRPFAEALGHAMRAGAPPAAGELAGFGPALGRLVPQWRENQAAGDESLVFLGEAVLRMLRLLSAPDGCLLVLEDLHWADPETLALLEYLADNLAAERVLCVATLRDEAEPRDEGGAGVAGGALRGAAAQSARVLEVRGSAAVVTLNRLDPELTASMARACMGAALPTGVYAALAERAEGVPFLIEEVLAGLVGAGALTEQDGAWQLGSLSAVGVPATFADAVAQRLSGLDEGARHVVGAAAVLGRRFDWSLLAAVTGLPDAAVVTALRHGVGLQLIVPDGQAFRFRHALTREAVLEGLLPPERARLAARALAAVEDAHPDLPGLWCVLASELAVASGEVGRAGELLLEAGRRDLAAGALASAERTLLQAGPLLAGAGAGPDLSASVEEALTEVYATSGKIDQALAAGRRLLARIGQEEPGRADTRDEGQGGGEPEAARRGAGDREREPRTLGRSSARAAALHLDIARAAIAGARWEQAAASTSVARSCAGADLARADACDAQIAAGQGRLAEADALARAALAAAERDARPEVACEALEVLGRVARQRDLDEAERAFSRAADLAEAHGLLLWRLRALHELGTVDQLRTESVDRLCEARELAARQGALALTATLDLQIAAGLNKQFRADEALLAARRSTTASRRFHLATLPMSLIFQATAHAIRGEGEEMEAALAEALGLAPEDPDVLGCAWGHCRATLSLLEEDLDRAYAQMTTGAVPLLGSPATTAPPFLGLWPLLGAVLGRDTEADAARVRSARSTRHLVVDALLGCADAVLAGRQGRPLQAERAFAAADARMAPLPPWYRQYARRLTAQAALADGWGEPVAWLREAADYFAARGDARVAAACRSLLRRAGAPVPRRRPGADDLPGALRALGVTEREAEVLRWTAQGLSNREIAEAMFLSPRTVEKHVASLLAKTGLPRGQLAGYAARLDG